VNEDNAATAGIPNVPCHQSNAEFGSRLHQVAETNREIQAFLLAQTRRLNVQCAEAQGNAHFVQRLLGQPKHAQTPDTTQVSAESWLQRALESLARLDQIISHTQVASKVWADSWQPRFQTIDIRKPLQEVLQLVRSELPYRHIDESITPPLEGDVILNSDVELLKVLFVEALSYALHQSFTPHAEMSDLPVFLSLQKEIVKVHVSIAYTHTQQNTEPFSERSLPQKILQMLDSELSQSSVRLHQGCAIFITLPLTDVCTNQ
jgi:hypothetical protein